MRWQEREHQVSDQMIIDALINSQDIAEISGLNTYSIDGVKYLDLSGISISNKTLDIGRLSNIDFSRASLTNVKFTSRESLANYRFEAAELVNVSFHSSAQEFDKKLTLKNFVFNWAKIRESEFSHNDFSGRHYFLNVRFDNVDFSNSDFGKSAFCDFSESKFLNCNFNKSILDGVVLSKCLFSDCDFRETRFNKTNLSDIAFRDCIVNSKTTFDDEIILEKNRSFTNAYDSYIQLKNLFLNAGHFLKYQCYYLREVHVRWKKEDDRIKKLFLIVWAVLAHIGQKPLGILFSSLCIVLFFSLVFFYTGICSNSKCMDFNGTNKIEYFLKCLYLSGITFTTLGYGDLTPIGWGCFWAIIEAFLGPILLSLFVALLIKRAIYE